MYAKWNFEYENSSWPWKPQILHPSKICTCMAILTLQYHAYSMLTSVNVNAEEAT